MRKLTEHEQRAVAGGLADWGGNGNNFDRAEVIRTPANLSFSLDNGPSGFGLSAEDLGGLAAGLFWFAQAFQDATNIDR